MAISDPAALVPGFSVQETAFTTGVNFTQAIGPSPYRIALWFTNVSSAGVFISLSPAPAASEGILVAASGPPIAFEMINNGGLCQQAWFAKQQGAGAILTIIESFYKPYLLGQVPDDDASDSGSPETVSGSRRYANLVPGGYDGLGFPWSVSVPDWFFSRGTKRQPI